MAISLRKIRIADASKLRFMNLLAGTQSVIEGEIRSYVTNTSVQVMVILKDDVESALVKIFMMDRKKCRVHLEFVFTESAELQDEDYNQMIRNILNFCFMESGFHKVTVTLSSRNIFLEKALKESGFIQEAVLRDEIRIGSRFEDAGLYAATCSEYLDYNVCFMAFTKGVIAIKGGREYISGVDIYHFGDELKGVFERNVAGSLGIIDEEYRLIDDVDLYEMEDEQLDFLPEELAKAYTELREYFSKKRERFDLNFRFDNSTEFQRKVWSVIQSIPYGGNMSYEEIALKITDNDMAEARRITRAVGSACGENPMLIMIPCHRVIGKDGKLTGYSAGVDIKDYLLLLESFSIIGGRRNG